MSTSESPRRLVSIAAAARYMDLHPMTVRRRIAAGDITAYKIGPRLLKVDLNEVDATLQPIPNARTGDEDLAAYIKRTVDAAPPLTDEMRRDLATLLRGGAA